MAGNSLCDNSVISCWSFALAVFASSKASAQARYHTEGVWLSLLTFTFSSLHPDCHTFDLQGLSAVCDISASFGRAPKLLARLNPWLPVFPLTMGNAFCLEEERETHFVDSLNVKKGHLSLSLLECLYQMYIYWMWLAKVCCGTLW